MKVPSYISVTDQFINGMNVYLEQKNIALSEVVEVFAGNGQLGLRLGLEPDQNISDLLMHQDKWYRDEISSQWDLRPKGVIQESADETVVRFKNNQRPIKLIIVAAPPPANSYYCPSYAMAKNLHDYNPEAKMLFVGELNSDAFASVKFFEHVNKVEDRLFEKWIQNTYHQQGYFKDQGILVKPYLLEFSYCNDVDCDCKNSNN
ncbi:hypothetical protein [Gracilibacillus kekensis]|uniref:Uncharacterized protein n=1 Tax=Gracilibacillus kekensis TaxID=1027249 RepID=A0A1M7Q8L2_9BACI|nr:hypothetical protein [Gracilibacillus kekensis]SHN26887.1 hypothetical protein SAMN05216179_2908 [Gracilibacillus kekensis]